MNSSLIDNEPQLDASIEIIAIPADELAVELGNKKAANMVVIGAYLQKRGQLDTELAVQALPETIAERYHRTLPVNTKAIKCGAEFASRNSQR